MTQRVVNYTYGTGNPVLPDGSIDVRDGIDNLQSLDVLMNAPEDTYNQRDGDVVKTVRGITNDFNRMLYQQEYEFNQHISGMAFTRVGTFESGATLDDLREVLLWDVSDGGDGHEYGWNGAFPKSVPPSSTPLSTGGVGSGAWVDRTDLTLRSELAAAGGAGLVGAKLSVPGSVYRTQADKNADIVSIKDFGGVGDGVTINDLAFQEAMALAETKPISLYIPPGIFKITETQALSLSGDISFKMVGAGSGTSVILVDTGGDGFIFNTPGNYSLWNTGPGRTAIELSGLSIATTQPLVGVGIKVNGNHVTGRPSATTIFNDVNVTSYSGASGQFFETGIELKNCSNVIFNNVHLYLGNGNTTSKGVHSFSESIANGGGALHFTDCTILFGGTQILVGDQQEGLYLTNCELVGGSIAVKYEPNTAQSGLHVIGCHMSSSDYNIYIHRLYHFEIIGGLYFNRNVNPAFMHIYCDIVNQFTISGNVFTGSNGASERGIHIGAAPDGPGNGGVITGNMFADLNIGVSLSTAANNIKESANLYRNCTTNVSNAASSENNILEYSQYHNTRVLTLTGGATSETVHITVNAAVFKKKPVSAMMNSPTNGGMVGFYDYTLSTETDLVFIVRRIDEAVIPANSYRFSISVFGTR